MIGCGHVSNKRRTTVLFPTPDGPEITTNFTLFTDRLSTENTQPSPIRSVEKLKLARQPLATQTTCYPNPQQNKYPADPLS